jgi:replicative DNA helicase
MTDALGGRTREEIEYDVLGSMVLIGPFRQRALPRLTASTFTTSDHRRLFRALRERVEPIDDAECFVARTLHTSMDAARDWLLNCLPTTYDEDLERLLDA